MWSSQREWHEKVCKTYVGNKKWYKILWPEIHKGEDYRRNELTSEGNITNHTKQVDFVDGGWILLTQDSELWTRWWTRFFHYGRGFSWLCGLRRKPVVHLLVRRQCDDNSKPYHDDSMWTARLRSWTTAVQGAVCHGGNRSIDRSCKSTHKWWICKHVQESNHGSLSIARGDWRKHEIFHNSRCSGAS